MRAFCTGSLLTADIKLAVPARSASHGFSLLHCCAMLVKSDSHAAQCATVRKIACDRQGAPSLPSWGARWLQRLHPPDHHHCCVHAGPPGHARAHARGLPPPCAAAGPAAASLGSPPPGLPRLPNQAAPHLHAGGSASVDEQTVAHVAGKDKGVEHLAVLQDSLGGKDTTSVGRIWR